MPEYRKKLIEVALPLEAVNKESTREKSIRHGHPSTLHLWWSRKPLATARAVLFAQLVDDPSSCPDEFPTEEAQETERQRLFRIIEEFVKWENLTNEAVLHKARIEIARSAARNHGVFLPLSMSPPEVADALKLYAPAVLDPFAGGGSIPLEAQRLGLEADASDLNPVAVLINKALIEIPLKFVGKPPINPENGKDLLQREWHGALGLVEDVRYYGKWMRDEAWKRIGHLYPKAELPKEYGGGEATVIAWLWARTIICPNPACSTQMPLVNKFWLSTKKGKEAWVEPVMDRATKTVHFKVQYGVGAPEGTVNRLGAKCIACGTPVGFDYIRSEGKSGRMGKQLIAIVAEGRSGRVYLSPNEKQVTAAEAKPEWMPDAVLPHNPRDFKTPNYGMRTFSDLFTPRQLVALTTFSDLVREAREKVLADASRAGLSINDVSLNNGETGANAYADAVTTYLGLGVSRLSDICNALCPWEPSKTQVRHLFGRQAIPMLWDFAEPNVFAEAAGDFIVSLGNLVKVLETLPSRGRQGHAKQLDAAVDINGTSNALISTDPPYYDNISYAVM
jgi:putative DNA methylase